MSRQLLSAPASNDSRHARTGFTLIELLVVIAIIAILASILFPVFARARENARRASCQSNLKQAGLAFMQYSQDYDEKMPITYGGATGWDTSIAPYLGIKVGTDKAPLLLSCPSDAIERLGPPAYPQFAGWQPRTYAMPMPLRTGSGANLLVHGLGGWYANNGALSSCNTAGNVAGCIALAAIPKPAETLLLAEYPAGGNFFGSSSGIFVPSALDQSTTSKKAIHLDSWNYLFADGHVKWLRPEKTVGTGTVASSKGMWTIDEND